MNAPVRPRFSIIMPSYNRSDVILNAIDSVRRQNFGDRVEVVVVDDSTDDTPRTVQEYAAAHTDLKIVYFHPEQRGRAAAARNKAIELAQGEYVVMLDTDDALTEGALAWMDEQIDQHDCTVFMGGVTFKSGARVIYDDRYVRRPLGVNEYLRILNEPETLPAVRTTFLRQHGLCYATDLIGFEGLLYLRIARAGGSIVRDPRPVRLYDDIGETRQSTVDNILRVSSWMAQGHGRLFGEFGREMKRNAPLLYWKTLLKAAVYARIADIPAHEAVRRHPAARLIAAMPVPLVRRMAVAVK